MLAEIEVQGINPIFFFWIMSVDIICGCPLKLFYTLEISGTFVELFLIYLPMYCSLIVSPLFRRASFLRSEL